MKCPNCGNEVQNDAVFCDQCGTRIPKPGAERPTATPPAAETTAVPVAQASVAPVAQASAPPMPAAAPAAQPAVGVICPKCSASNTPGELFCGECGAPLAAPAPEPTAVVATQVQPVVIAAAPAAPGARVCPACGATVAAGDEFCYACGADLRAQAAAAAAPTEAQAQPTVSPAPVSTPAPAAPAPAAPIAVAPSITPAAAPGNPCPSCGAQVTPGDVFCQACGSALTAPTEASVAPTVAQPTPQAAAPIAQPTPQPVQATQPAPQAPAAGPRLIVVASGAEIPIAPGKETLVGREDPYSGVFPDVDLSPHGAEEGGVSRRHFKITLAGGQYMIEDLNSTNSTVLNRQRLQPGAPALLADGDEIRAGRVRLVFKVS